MTACVFDWKDIIRVNGLPLTELCFTVMNEERCTAEVKDG